LRQICLAAQEIGDEGKNKENQMKKVIRRKRGFTLIELLVVVLILAILMAVALPLYLSAVADSEKKTCRSNMQTIANAVQAYRVKNRLPDYTGCASWDLTVDLQSAPTCPANPGAYAVATSGSIYSVSCPGTVGAHGSFSPGQGS